MPANKTRQQLKNLSVAATMMNGKGDVEIGYSSNERTREMLRKMQTVQSDNIYREMCRVFSTKLNLINNLI
jgi:hypothetical protein